MCCNVKGIAEQIISEMKEQDANLNNMDDYTYEAFRAIQSKVPSQAKLIIERVKDLITKIWEN